MSKARHAALLLLLLLGGAAGLRGQSALDGFDPNANNMIRVLVVQPDGKILIGGEFTTVSPNGGAAVTRNRIARLNPDGTLDTAFNPDANNTVYAIAVQADGKILVAGDFRGANSIGGQTRNHIARLDATTGLADSFDPNASGSVYSLAVQGDGKIVAGGIFSQIGGQTRNLIARLDATTGLADSFNPDAHPGIIWSVLVQPDGKILAGGDFAAIGGQPRHNLARLDATTGLADSFNPNASAAVWNMAVQADGKVLVGGFFTGANSIGGQARNCIARLDATTGLADSFDPNAGAFAVVRSIVVQADGRILVGGSFNTMGGQARHHLARLDPITGQADPLDTSPNNDVVWSIAVQADGKILVSGNFTTLANGGATVVRNGIGRLEADGRLDKMLDLGIAVGNGVIAIALQPDRKTLIGGHFQDVTGVPRNNMARLNTDGTLDAAFNPNADNDVYAIAVQPDGKILVCGEFTNIGGQPRNYIARLDPTTGLADSFDPNANARVNTIAVQADGKVLIGGLFYSVNGQWRNRIARLDGTTGLPDAFDPNAQSQGLGASVIAIALQSDGRILVGGGFTDIALQPRHGMARLDPATGLPDSFDPNPNPGVDVIAVQSDGRILTGGTFHSIGGQTRQNIARLDPKTALADSFNPNPFNGVNTIAVQADGKVLAGGFFSGFTGIGGQPRNYVGRLDGTTGLADSFDPNSGSYVYALAVQADGKILVGGSFETMGGVPRTGLARLSNDTAALQDLAVTSTAITWTRGGSSPDLTRVTFEWSTDNANYTPLGNGTATGRNWSLTGLSLPRGQNFYVRARGYYRSGYWNGSESITESVRRAFLKPPSQALNLSTRMQVETGYKVGIGGFIITGSAPKHVLLRALRAMDVKFDLLVDPVLALHGSGPFPPLTNDNWRDDPLQEAAILATGLAPNSDLDAAIDTILPPGAYTAVVQGKNGTSGVGLIELYDLSPSLDSKVANLSTRALVSTSGNIVIAGFILGGAGGDTAIVVRGLGPSLTSAGVPDALANPTLQLRDENGVLLAENNDWQDDPGQAAELTAAGLALPNQLESGLALVLPPGAYTALLLGLDDGTGVGLVEFYELGAP